jgi:hypothetical protein
MANVFQVSGKGRCDLTATAPPNERKGTAIQKGEALHPVTSPHENSLFKNAHIGA